MRLDTTPSQTVGPYFHLGLTGNHAVGCMAGSAVKGERVKLVFTVLDADGKPVSDAMIEIWQADASGRYNHPEDTQDKPRDSACPGFGRMGTDENGMCEFDTIKPGCVPGPGGVRQAPHLNISVFARGLLKRLPTRMYFADDIANESDPVLALVPAERRHTLIAMPEDSRPGTWRFTVALSGDDETVFFDI